MTEQNKDKTPIQELIDKANEMATVRGDTGFVGRSINAMIKNLELEKKESEYIKSLSENKDENKHEISLKSWNHSCGDGCCDTYGTTIIIDGVELEQDGEDKANLLEAVLSHFKIKATVDYNE